MTDNSPICGGLREALAECPGGTDFSVFELDVTDSTSSHLLRMLDEGAGPLTVVTARQQTAGRGRQGNTWHSADRENLYISVSFELSGDTALLLPAVPLASGVAAADGLRQSGLSSVCLKWPNDLLVNGRKLGGILCEARRVTPQKAIAVVGMGVNCGRLAFPDELKSIAIHMKALGFHLDRERFAAGWLVTLRRWLARLQKEGLKELVARWVALGEPFGRRVRCGRVEGITTGLSPEGRLLVKTDAGAVVDLPGGVVETVDVETVD